MVYDYARKIENSNIKVGIIEFVDKLMTFYPQYSQFETAFKLIGYSNKVKSYRTPAKKRDVQYILKEIENYWQNSTQELCVVDFSIEHIANDNGGEANCRIGNLLPLAEPVNNSIGSISFIEKKEGYRKSNFISVHKFLERNLLVNEWNDLNIDKRSSFLAKLAYDKIWNVASIEIV